MNQIYRYLLAIFVIFIAISNGVYAQENCAITDKTPKTVSVDWLTKHIDHKKLVLLHIGNKKEYDDGHIPGAQYLSTRDVSLPHEEGGLALQLPSAKSLKATFEKFGITNDSRIILYFGKDWVTSTTRIFFTLDYLGLINNTSVLDGGMPAWMMKGKTLTKEIPKPRRGFLEVESNKELVANAGWLKSKLKDPTVKIIDARTPNHYTGTSAGGFPRPGHIPGAKNIPFTEVVDKSLKLKDKEEIKKLFINAGVKPYDTVVVYCHIGQQASLVYLAAKSLGYKVKLYDGSFQEWSKTKGLPVVDKQAGKRGTKVSVVSPKWVEKHAGDKDLRILDVRLNVYDYFASHIPNAVHLADASLRAPKGGYPTQYLDGFMLGRLFSQAGINKGDKVVVYSDGNGVLGAAMVAYLLERYGHREIFFVDGGFRDYKASNKTSQSFPKANKARFDLLDNTKVRANLADVKASIGKSGVTFIDARPPDVFRGEKKIWVRNGHIPGAINIPWVRLMEENNRHKLKPIAEIRKIFLEAGVRPTDDIIVYCGTSREASLEYMILKHILKLSKVRLYEGSWTEYSSHPELKVETVVGK